MDVEDLKLFKVPSGNADVIRDGGEGKEEEKEKGTRRRSKRSEKKLRESVIRKDSLVAEQQNLVSC